LFLKLCLHNVLSLSFTHTNTRVHMRMLVYLMYVFYLNLFSVIFTRCILITYQSLMLHSRNNNYSYLTKYIISDFGAQLSPRLFPLILIIIIIIIIIYYSRTRESRISLTIITLWSNILKFRLQIEHSDSRRDV